MAGQKSILTPEFLITMSSSIRNRLLEFFGLRANVVALLVAIVVIGSGEELWMRFIPKYLEVLGAGALVIGLYDGLKTLLGAVYAYPGGIIDDAWGPRRALAFFTGLSIAGYGLVFAVPHWGAVLAATFLFLAWSSLSLPATFSLVGKNLAPEKYGMGIAVQSIIRRVPVMVGPVLGGALMDRLGFRRGVRIAVLVSAALAAVAILVQRRISSDARGARAPSPRIGAAFREFSPELRQLLLSDILVRFCERIPFAWVVIYAMAQPGIGAKQFGLLTTLEVTTAIVCFVPAAYLSDRHGREAFVVATFVFFTLFPLFLLEAESAAWLAAAFVVRGLKEFGEPARKALIIHYSSGPRQGQLIGAYYLARDLTVAPGALLGAWLWHLGPRMNFAGAFLCGVLGTISYVFVLWRRRARPARPSIG